jgi:homoserine O-succinyltransferase
MNALIRSPAETVGRVYERPLVIGLINSTSERARRTTELQFMALLQAAASETPFQFKFFAFREIMPSAPPVSFSGMAYADVSTLPEAGLDALIVTGMEPRAKQLEDESIWDSFVKVVDWTERTRLPVAWSCLAAHAAVLYLDGICRTPNSSKISGVFEMEVAAPDHPFMEGIDTAWRSPHSRQFGLDEDRLVANGYRILARSAECGVDSFVKNGLPFLFLQGHPEYAADTLMREYMRDMRRYVLGESVKAPAIPHDYFDGATEAPLATQARLAEQNRGELSILVEMAKTAQAGLQAPPWQPTATRLFANWIASIPRPDHRALPGFFETAALLAVPRDIRPAAQR